jgi:hypothetical protein
MLARHIASCASCAGAYRRLEREQELFLRYECDAEAAQNFWANVMARAAEERVAQAPGLLSNLRGWFRHVLGNFAAPRFSPSLTALIVLIAIGITVLLMSHANHVEKQPVPNSISRSIDQPTIPSMPEAGLKPSDERENRAAKESDTGTKSQPQSAQSRRERSGEFVLAANRKSAGRTNHRPTPDELVREAEQKYVAAINMLSRDVNHRRTQLDPEAAARFERTLAAVDRTIAETRRAVREHPGDPLAAKYMLTAYSKKVDVLREMVGY